MMSAILEVVKAGPYSTVQDSGRMGFLDYGVSPAGACDPVYHAIANLLVGNDPKSPVVEFTLKGDMYRVVSGCCTVGIAGDFAVFIDGEKRESWRSFTLEAGQTLEIGNATKGLRGYMSVAGALDIVPVLGSYSVHARSGIGPLSGNTFQPGDQLPIRVLKLLNDDAYAFDHQVLLPRSEVLRVVLGPQEHLFSEDAITSFLNSKFTVSQKCDRMGYHIGGVEIDYNREVPLISEGIALGSVQVLGQGQYIVPLMDRQTVGGYPKIATIIGSDVRNLLQAPPLATIRFSAISVAQARGIAKDRANFIKSLTRHIRPVGVYDLSSERLLSLNLVSGVFAEEQLS
jgi:biotin-dependent carboxylase-like uncharacterized protein